MLVSPAGLTNWSVYCHWCVGLWPLSSQWESGEMKCNTAQWRFCRCWWSVREGVYSLRCGEEARPGSPPVGLGWWRERERKEWEWQEGSWIVNGRPGQFALGGPGSAAAKSRINHEAVVLCRPSLSALSLSLSPLSLSLSLSSCLAHKLNQSEQMLQICMFNICVCARLSILLHKNLLGDNLLGLIRNAKSVCFSATYIVCVCIWMSITQHLSLAVHWALLNHGAIL